MSVRHFTDAFILHGLIKDDDEPEESPNENCMADEEMIIPEFDTKPDHDNVQDHNEDFQEVIDRITYWVLKDDMLLKTTITEGLIKLILGNVISRPEIWFSILFFFLGRPQIQAFL